MARTTHTLACLFLVYFGNAQVLKFDSLKASNSNSDSLIANYIRGCTNQLLSDKSNKVLAELNNFLISTNQSRYPYSLASAHNALGFGYYAKGDYEKALDHLFESKEIADSLGFQLCLASVDNAIGLIFIDVNDYPKGIKHLKNSCSLYSKLITEKNESESSRSYPISAANLGHAYTKILDFEKAIHYSLIALEHAIEIGYTRAEQIALTRLGSAFFEDDKLDKAKDAFKRSVKLKNQVEDKLPLMATYLGLARIAELENDYLEAKRLSRLILLISNKTEIKLWNADAYKIIQEGFDKVGSIDSAYYYLKLHNEEKGAIAIQKSIKQLQLFEFQKQQVADSLKRVEFEMIKALSAQKELQKKQRINKLQYSLVVIVVFLLASIITVIARFNISLRLASGLIFIFFILTFEFLLVVLDPWVDSISNGEVGWKIAINTAIALVLFGIHQVSEKKLKTAILKADR
ncbi:MAG: tetratricopeptide repeat protein [Bacteroidia bacterium]